MREKQAWSFNGFIAVIAIIILLGLAVITFLNSSTPFGIAMSISSLLFMVLCIVLALILLAGLVVLQPNEAMVLTFFGKYMGTIRQDGFFFAIPASKRKISLRVRNFNSETLKVNDVDGNPIEISAVIVFRVVDAAKAVFDVDSYESFVRIQSETALRHMATKYPYDSPDTGVISLRGNTEEVAQGLAQELQEKLRVAGVQVLEARLNHLAYAPEIASAMLQRQQANAIVAARQKIVEGAVGMVDDALSLIEAKKVIQLTEEQKAQMISNLMVAIVSEKGTQPVMQAGNVQK